MKINEIFESIQGEGKFAGYPVLFIRTSGCTRKCSWCDTKYHEEGKEMTVDEIVIKIEKSGKQNIVWTGGEPLLQKNDIYKVIDRVGRYHHIETNGDLLKLEDLDHFNYICCSPKTIEIAKKVYVILGHLHHSKYDIKSVIKEGFQEEYIKYSTMLMPLTEYNGIKNNGNEQYVWNKSLDLNKKFCLRQHIKVWGNKRGI